MKESMKARFGQLKFYPPQTQAPCPQKLRSIGFLAPFLQETALVLLAGASHVRAAIFLHKYNSVRISWSARCSALPENTGQDLSVLTPWKGRPRKGWQMGWGRNLAKRPQGHLWFLSKAVMEAGGDCQRDRESRLGARGYWQVPGGGITRMQGW